MFSKMGAGKESQLSWSRLDHKTLMHPTNPLHSGAISLPEGRVHGGRLMAMLSSNACHGSHSGSQVKGGNSEQDVPSTSVPKWL